jgi:GxxExxY protein
LKKSHAAQKPRRHGDTEKIDTNLFIRKVMLNNDIYFDATQQIVDSCITVHKHMGPGLLESLYECCLIEELQSRGLNVQNRVEIPLVYKGKELKKTFVIDLLVNDEIILELKSVDTVHPVFEAQLLSYLKLANKKVGYLLNFNIPLMKNGIKRMKNGY